LRAPSVVMKWLAWASVVVTTAALVAPAACDDATVVDADTPASQDSTTEERAELLLRDIVKRGIDASEELSEVEEKKLYERGVRLNKANPGYFVGIFNRQKERGREISKFAYASLEASNLLAQQ